MQSSCRVGTDTIHPPNVALFPLEEQKNAVSIFEFKGAPMVIPPLAPRGLQEKRRKPTTGTQFNDDRNWFPESSYYTVNLDTQNILDNSLDFIRQTTLKYPNNSSGILYDCKFVCLHQNLFGVETGTVQLSIFFQSRDAITKFFHICIPVNFSPVLPEQTENQFLKAWLKPNNRQTLPPGFTFNEVLNFRSTPSQAINYTTIQYCLNLKTFNENASTINSTYVFCIFNSPLYINQISLPRWVTTLTNPEDIVNEQYGGLYMRKHFSEIFNLMYRGVIRKDLGFWNFTIGNEGVFVKNVSRNTTPVIEPSEVRQVSDTNFMGASPLAAENSPKPIYYLVLNKNIVQMPRIKEKAGTRSLSGIKCYPMDIATQVDEQGSIVIDELNRKPVDIFDVKETSDVKQQVANAGLDLEQSNNIETIFKWVFFVIIGLGVLILVIVIIIKFLPGTSFSARAAATPIVGMGGVVTGTVLSTP